MAIQYAGGTIIERTTVPVTRADLCNFLTQAVSDAGWTTISGTPGSGADVLMETAAGNQGQKIRVRFVEPGGANACMQMRLQGVSGSPAGTFGYCLPFSTTWRVMANKFFFFAFASGATNRQAARLIAYAGTLFVPTFLPLSAGDNVGYLVTTGIGDADSSTRHSFRTSLRSYDALSGPRATAIWQTQMFDFNGITNSVGGDGSLVFQGGYHTADQGFRWQDDSPLVYEPLIAWGLTLSTDEAKIRGQLYGAMIVNQRYSGEYLMSYDGHNWRAITDSATQSIAATNTLFMAVS